MKAILDALQNMDSIGLNPNLLFVGLCILSIVFCLRPKRIKWGNLEIEMEKPVRKSVARRAKD